MSPCPIDRFTLSPGYQAPSGTAAGRRAWATRRSVGPGIRPEASGPMSIPVGRPKPSRAATAWIGPSAAVAGGPL